MPVMKKPKRKYEHGGSVVNQESMENLLGYTDEENKSMDELIKKALLYEKPKGKMMPKVKLMKPKVKTMPKGYTDEERKSMDELIKKTILDEKPKERKAKGGLIKGASAFQGTSGYSKIESFEGHSSAKTTPKKKVKK